MSSRHRRRDLIERVRVLTTAEEQPRIVGRLPVRFVTERGPEGNADGDQPVEVLPRALAVGNDPIIVHARPERRAQESDHVVNRVLEATGDLEGRPAAQIDQATRIRRRTPGLRTPFDSQNGRPRLPRRHGRTGTGNSQPDHDDIDRLVELNPTDL